MIEKLIPIDMGTAIDIENLTKGKIQTIKDLVMLLLKRETYFFQGLDKKGVAVGQSFKVALEERKI